MRLNELEITAFGPFADTVSVDFDALSQAGLFLLTGATGAGKTSILDAVCFALYGEVPGDRQGAKRLRSDQAPPGLAAEVRLELTVAGRRLRIVRSPAWQRPKKRGSGTTTEQAAVHLSERVGDAWVPLSSRLDETGLQVTSLLGMNATQFCQVVMLPQGRFQSFLRARSEERHRLLQQLFRTARFEEVERWLGERRRTLRRASARHADVVAGLVNRISEAADEALPDAWDVHDLAGPRRPPARSRPGRPGSAKALTTRPPRRARAPSGRPRPRPPGPGRSPGPPGSPSSSPPTPRPPRSATGSPPRPTHRPTGSAGSSWPGAPRRCCRSIVLAGDQERAAEAARLHADTLTAAATQLLGSEPTGASEPDLAGRGPRVRPGGGRRPQHAPPRTRAR